MFYYYDWTMILLVPVIIFTIYAQAKVSSNYNRYYRASDFNRHIALRMLQRVSHLVSRNCNRGYGVTLRNRRGKP